MTSSWSLILHTSLYIYTCVKHFGMANIKRVPTLKTMPQYVGSIRYGPLAFTFRHVFHCSVQLAPNIPELHITILFPSTTNNLKHFTQKAFHSVTTHAYCNTITKLTQTHNAFPLQGMKENCNETIRDRLQSEAYTVRNIVEGSILFSLDM